MNREEFHTLFEKHDFEKIISDLNPLEIGDIDKRKLALVYFHTEYYEEAFKLFQLISLESKNAIDWFNLASAAIYVNKEDTALEALDKALNLNKETRTDGQGIPPAFMLFVSAQNFYNVSKYDTAFILIDRLSLYYKKIRYTNYEILDNNGIPHFDIFIKFVATLLPKLTVEIDYQKWLATWSDDLDENGKHKIL